MLNWENNNGNGLGNILVETGKIEKRQLEKALSFEKSSGKNLIEILTDLNYISEEVLVGVIAKKFSIAVVDLDGLQIDEKVPKKIPKEVANKYNLIPFKEEDGKICVAMSDPTNLMALDDLRFITSKDIKIFIAKSTLIKSAIEKYYNNHVSNRAIEEMKQEYSIEIKDQRDAIDDVANEVDNAPAVKFTNALLVQAIEAKASDIHVEPFEEEVVVRYRIDGVLKETMTIPINLYSSVSTRLKIIAGMNIAEKRIPQDGRIEMIINEKPYDFRVSCLPTVYGEKIVLRILDRSSILVDREKLGFTDYENKLIDKALASPHGILLVTGPTGSGKTTTLYTFLKELNTPEVNIITIEDPVEYMLNRINQVHVNSKAGMTFASGLRSMLRQDPDVIMIGEIRDEETAEIAVRASITGHFVLSTLHTNDAPSSLTRLIDMGLESYLVADAVVGIIAQRLVRRLCPHCKEKSAIKEREREILGEGIDMVYDAKGCNYCNNTGYKGRVAVHEVLIMNKSIRSAVEEQVGADKIRETAIENGMVTLFENCKELIKRGETTIHEMVQIAYERD